MPVWADFSSRIEVSPLEARRPSPKAFFLESLFAFLAAAFEAVFLLRIPGGRAICCTARGGLSSSEVSTSLTSGSLSSPKISIIIGSTSFISSSCSGGRGGGAAAAVPAGKPAIGFGATAEDRFCCDVARISCCAKESPG